MQCPWLEDDARANRWVWLFAFRQPCHRGCMVLQKLHKQQNMYSEYWKRTRAYFQPRSWFFTGCSNRLRKQCAYSHRWWNRERWWRWSTHSMFCEAIKTIEAYREDEWTREEAEVGEARLLRRWCVRKSRCNVSVISAPAQKLLKRCGEDINSWGSDLIFATNQLGSTIPWPNSSLVCKRSGEVEQLVVRVDLYHLFEGCKHFHRFQERVMRCCRLMFQVVRLFSEEWGRGVDVLDDILQLEQWCSNCGSSSRCQSREEIHDTIKAATNRRTIWNSIVYGRGTKFGLTTNGRIEYFDVTPTYCHEVLSRSGNWDRGNGWQSSRACELVRCVIDCTSEDWVLRRWTTSTIS